MGDTLLDAAAASADADRIRLLLQDKLVDEFRSRLDDTLVIAIIGDYDLSNDEQFHQARGILDDLAQNATIEEESGFNFVNIGGKDESGLAGDDSPDNLEGLDAPAIASTSNSTRLPTDCGDLTDFTDFSDTLSERFATLEFSNDINIATLDDDGKVAELQTMFPLLPELDLRLTLKKRKGDFVKACEDLLNMQYLEENGLRPKGIDGAFHQYGLEGYRARLENAKEKGKNRLDIDYRLTPADLCEEDTVITNTVTPTASASFSRRSSLPRLITVASTVANVNLSAPDSPVVKPTQWQVVQSKQKNRSESSPTSPVPGLESTDLITAQRAAARRLRARGGHYRAAAFVAAERAREQVGIIRAVESQNYDIMVDQSSTSNKIDLHGLPVADGVRIALERTRRWWSNLGEDRARRAKEDVFTVVTGMGNHNSGGVSRMRQEVGAALRREGWRLTTGTGQYFISGKV